MKTLNLNLTLLNRYDPVFEKRKKSGESTTGLSSRGRKLAPAFRNSFVSLLLQKGYPSKIIKLINN
jgi:hypothetical protein